MTETSKQLAERCADNIRGYWSERGYSVLVWVERLVSPVDSREPLYLLRSEFENCPGGIPSLTDGRVAAV